MTLNRRLRSLSVPTSLLLVTGVLFWRKPDGFTNPQLWAEDGTIFFRTAYLEGPRAILEPYSGYFHLFPRLVAALADLAPYAYTPALYNAAALATTWAVVAKLHSSRLGLPAPLAFSLMLAFVPHFTGEVFANLTNAQWFLAILLFSTALQDPPETQLELLGDLSVIVIAGLSTPAIVLAVPLLAYRVWKEPSVRLWCKAALSAGVAAAQATVFLQRPVVLAPSPGHTSASWADLLGRKTVGNLFLGRKAPYELPATALLAAGVLLLAWIVWRLARLRPLGSRFGLPSLAIGLALLTLVFYKFRHAADLLVPPAAAARYFYVPWVVLSWCLLLVLLEDRTWHRAVAAALLAAILHSSLTTVFRSPPLRDFQWESYAPALEAREPIWIPINPPGWRIELAPPGPPREPPNRSSPSAAEPGR